MIRTTKLTIAAITQLLRKNDVEMLMFMTGREGDVPHMPTIWFEGNDDEEDRVLKILKQHGFLAWFVRKICEFDTDGK